ncbi:putative oligomerization/nucleic acid binding protein [Murinocardiopsis flavida]|uniref:Putative oligomerization/nucleic acid binding protein n=1 Tax=Murinocardiopsis flavida TaxID=645275 RepID=A0A2P8D6X6_9ACTN|nr:DUF4429 domain-containing protein [Murinocardiopsis flavida]PSK92973.1 putative oligomerization/nucleic acid binding protein [Murinocardiopsis flavida]
MDELRGDRAVWRFDGESIAIRYTTRRFGDHLFKALVHCDMPVNAVAAVDFQPGAGRKKGWIMHLRLRERTDPYSVQGAALAKDLQPFLITGPAKTELLAEYYAEQIAFSVDNAAADPPPDTATRLVPQVPLHIQTSEGTAAFDGSVLRFVWSGSEAASRKRKQQRREFPLDAMTSVEWIPSDGWEYGHLRANVRDAADNVSAKPKNDFSCLLFDEGKETSASLLMAATVTAHLWAREGRPGVGSGAGRPPALESGDAAAPAPAGPATDTGWIYAQIEALGGLHAKGVLTDDEFTAKKAELLGRI